ncbi:hypothetical protein [Chitinophaga barathri]|nr:hypothetical protein [Chitinophaga barathri]
MEHNHYPVRILLLWCLCLFTTAGSAQVTAQSLLSESPGREEGLYPPLSKDKKPKPTPPWYVDRFRVSAGVFFPINNTDVSVGTQDGTIGTNIDFENDLGFNKNTFTFMGDFQWRISRRSRLNFNYFRVARTSEYTLQRDITFGEHTYPVDGGIRAIFNTDIFRLSYGYAFFTNPKFEAGLLVGAHVVGLDAGIALYGNTASIEFRDDFGITAPLPDVGIWGGYAFSSRWYVNAEFDYLALTVGDYKGRILGYNLNVHYRIIDRLDAAIGYTGLNARVDADKERLVGYFKWGYNGPSLTVSYSFGKKPW